MRLRIPIGKFVSEFTDNFSSIMIIVAIIVSTVAITCPGVVQAQEPERRLVVAEGQGWHTEGFAKEVCQIYPCIEGSYIRRTYPAGFYTTEARPESFTHVQYRGVSFFIPPVGALQSGATFGPIVNDGTYGTTVTVFSGGPTSLSLTVGDKSQRCDVSPPVTQCELQAFVYVGTLTIEKAPGVGCPGCEADKLFGFVSVAARPSAAYPDGGAVRVLPFGE